MTAKALLPWTMHLCTDEHTFALLLKEVRGDRSVCNMDVVVFSRGFIRHCTLLYMGVLEIYEGGG